MPNQDFNNFQIPCKLLAQKIDFDIKFFVQFFTLEWLLSNLRQHQLQS